MTIDVHVLGVRLYLSLDKPHPVAQSNEPAPTTLATPMQVHAGYSGFYQIRPDYTEVHEK